MKHFKSTERDTGQDSDDSWSMSNNWGGGVSNPLANTSPVRPDYNFQGATSAISKGSTLIQRNEGAKS